MKKGGLIFQDLFALHTKSTGPWLRGATFHGKMYKCQIQQSRDWLVTSVTDMPALLELQFAPKSLTPKRQASELSQGPGKTSTTYSNFSGRLSAKVESENSSFGEAYLSYKRKLCSHYLS